MYVGYIGFGIVDVNISATSKGRARSNFNRTKQSIIELEILPNQKRIEENANKLFWFFVRSLCIVNEIVRK